MESLAEGNHLSAPVVEGGQFQRIFIRFGTAVDKKQAVIIVTGNLAQPFGYLLLQFVVFLFLQAFL